MELVLEVCRSSAYADTAGDSLAADTGTAEQLGTHCNHLNQICTARSTDRHAGSYNNRCAVLDYRVMQSTLQRQLNHFISICGVWPQKRQHTPIKLHRTHTLRQA